MSNKWANSTLHLIVFINVSTLEFLEIDSLTTNDPCAFGKFIKRWVSKRTRHNELHQHR